MYGHPAIVGVGSLDLSFVIYFSSLFKASGSWSYRDPRGTGFGLESLVSLDMNICGPIKGTVSRERALLDELFVLTWRSGI